LRIGYQWWMLSRRGAGPPLDSVPPSSPCAAAAPGARLTDAQGAGHPCMRWPPIVARPSSRRIFALAVRCTRR